MIYVTSAQSCRTSWTTILGSCRESSRRTLALDSSTRCPTTARSGRCPLKLLERPRLLAQIRDLIPDKDRAHLVPYNTTELERDLAIRLGIPMYGADPRHFELGTKSGCRKLFGRAGVSYPMGAEDLRTEDEVLDALARLRVARPRGTLRDGQAQRGRLGCRQRGREPLGSARAGRQGRARGPPRAAQGDEVRERAPELRHVHGASSPSSRGSWRTRHRRGDPSPSVQLRITPLASSRFCPRTTRCSAGPAGRAISAAASPRTPPMRP